MDTHQKEMFKKINVLSNKDKYRLYKWVEENKDSLTSFTRDQIALKASKNLGVIITRGNIDGAVSVIGVQTKRAMGVKGRLESNVGKNVLIAKALQDLYILTGNEPPAYLGEIAANHTLDAILKSFNDGERG